MSDFTASFDNVVITASGLMHLEAEHQEVVGNDTCAIIGQRAVAISADSDDPTAEARLQNLKDGKVLMGADNLTRTLGYFPAGAVASGSVAGWYVDGQLLDDLIKEKALEALKDLLCGE